MDTTLDSSGAQSAQDLDSPDTRLKSWAYILVPLGVLFVLLLLAYYPGFMSTDSRVQLAQGRAGSFTDFYPPLMAAIWGYFDSLWPGPAGMLLLHMLLFFSGVALLVKHVERRCGRAAYLLLILPVMPHIVAILGTIWKDVLMGAALVLTGALLSGASHRNRFVTIPLSAVAVFLAASVRLNALPAILPFCIWTVYVWWNTSVAKGPRTPRFRILLVSFVYLGVVTAAGSLVTKALTHGVKGYNVQMIFLFDLAALSIAHNTPEFPLYVHQGPRYSFDKVKEISTLGGVSPLVFDDATVNQDVASGRFAVTLDDFLGRWGGPLKMTNDPALIGELVGQWAESVGRDPTTYLRHRWTIFSRLISWGHAGPFYPFHFETDPTLSAPFSWCNGMLKRYLNSTETLVVSKAWFWLALSTLTFCTGALFHRVPYRAELLVFASSALLYGACFFLIAPAPDNRYVWWCNVAGSISVFLAFIPLFSAGRRTVQQH